MTRAQLLDSRHSTEVEIALKSLFVVANPVCIIGLLGFSIDLQILERDLDLEDDMLHFVENVGTLKVNLPRLLEYFLVRYDT